MSDGIQRKRLTGPRHRGYRLAPIPPTDCELSLRAPRDNRGVGRKGLRGPWLGALVVVLLSGCAHQAGQDRPGTGMHWPGVSDVRHAAAVAARDPHTWVPIAGAAMLTLGNADGRASDWFADHHPVFGTDAGDTSDRLADLSTIAFYATALAAPGETMPEKFGNVVLGAATLAVNRAATGGLKSAVGRDRPNGRDDRSFPSGHASGSSTAATMTVHNLDHYDMPGWLANGATWGLYGLAGATGLARVEAGEHHLSDVLVGYSLGHFLAVFMQESFVPGGHGQARVGFSTAADGSGGLLWLELGL